MLEFRDLVYLDVEKTGSTTVRVFLKQFVASPPSKDRKHRPVKARSLDKTYVISCRQPVDQYRSLYKHGAESKGMIRELFGRAGLSYLYDLRGDGFAEWLEYLLDYEWMSKNLVRRHFHPATKFFGLQTLRFLTLDLPGGQDRLDGVESRDDVLRVYREHRVHDVLLRTESLTEDLRAMVRGARPGIFSDPGAAEAYLSRQPKKNVSREARIESDRLPDHILSKVFEREWFFFEELGYPREPASDANSAEPVAAKREATANLESV